MSSKISPFIKGVRVALKRCMGLKADESILIVADKNKNEIAKLFLEEAKKISGKAKLISTPVAEMNGQEPPKNVAKMMKKFDVALLITTKSLSHTKARKAACKCSVRIASMPGISKDMLKTLDVDYSRIRRMNKKLKNILSRCKTLRVKTRIGSDIVMNIKNRKVFDDNGDYSRAGSFGNLPAGEVCLAPIEGTANGVYIIDGSFGSEKLAHPLKMVVKEGYIVDVIGSEKLKKSIFSLEKDYRNIAEFGIGTNYKAKLRGIVLEDEKVLGTVHIAIGNNLSFGGRIDVPMHIDGIILKPTVWAGKTKVMENGNLREKIFKCRGYSG